MRRDYFLKGNYIAVLYIYIYVLLKIYYFYRYIFLNVSNEKTADKQQV